MLKHLLYHERALKRLTPLEDTQNDCVITFYIIRVDNFREKSSFKYFKI